MRSLFLLLFCIIFSRPVWAQCDNLLPMYGDNCVKSAKLRKADEQFRQTVIKQNGSADSAARVYLSLGWNYFRNDDAATAMKRFNQAWLLDPENPEVYFAFGHLVRYAFAKNAADAVRYYKLGRLRDPEKEIEKKSLLRLLTALETRDDPQAAIDVSSQLVVDFPTYRNAIGYKAQAFYYTRMQMPDRAILDYEKALELDPTDANSYLGRGYAFSWQRKHQQALADYEKAITLDPNLTQAYVSRAVLYADSLNQPAKALPDLEKALQLASEVPELYLLKSTLLLKLNRKPEACTVLKNAIAGGHKSLEPKFREMCGN